MFDQQGNVVRQGIAYQFMFGHGDFSTLVVLKVMPDGKVRGYDVNFKFEVELETERLWRPLRHTWAAWPTDAKAVLDYCGEAALNLD